ncbi:MAG: hypothetical protein Phog2KO_32850 [Phototrophicaceae bacterium]
MPYEVNWIIKDEIIYIKFWGNGSSEELREALTTVTKMRKDSPRNLVHIITDIKKVARAVPFQDSVKIMREFQSPSDDGWEIVVGNLNKIMELSLKISRSLLSTKSINFKSIDDAFSHLKKEDSSLSWDKLNQELVDSIRG